MLKHELTLQEIYVLEWILHLPIWADKIILKNKTIYFASKNKACDDLPMITTVNDTMQRYYRRLESKGLIAFYKVSNKDYIEILPKCAEWNSVIKTTTSTDEHDDIDVDNTTTSTTNSNLNNSILDSKTLFDVDDIKDLPKQVLQYLNEQKPGPTPFQFVSKNLELIKSRIKEGFKFEDFRTVIDFKISSWKDNAKMKKYIRPETLFGTKFDGYVVESKDWKPNGNDGSNNFQYKPQKTAVVK